MSNEPLVNPNDFILVGTKPFKLKDYPANRRFQMIDLKLQFKEVPQVIAIEKVQGQNNKIVVRAFIPKKKVTGGE